MSQRLRVLEEIFHAAMAVSDEQRAACLAERCAGDAQLRSDVESLLWHAERSTGSFEHHIGAEAAKLLATSTPRPVLTPGTFLGAYRVERVLGEGGMGVVYLATDTRLHRQVAVKMIGGHVAATPDDAAHLLSEACAAAALAHPNIASLYDCGATDGVPWFVMEYVPGGPMRAALQTGPLPEDDLVSFTRQIAAALEYAHARQVIHRDLKPENVLLTDDGVVKVIDFGLATAAHGGADAGAVPLLRGTLRYMAPEVLTGQRATPASDVYSVGVLLFEMATGQHPFAGASGSALTTAIVSGASPDPAAMLPLWRRHWATVIKRCMAVEPATRYRDGAELSAALAGLTAPSNAAGDLPVRSRLVVLDFVSVTGEDAWLGTAIADTVAADLSQVSGVTVATRHGGAASRGNDITPLANAAVVVGREHGAQWVVAGTYQRSGSRVRVTPTLIEVMTGSVVSAGKVDGSLEAVFELQDEVVATLRGALGLDRARGLPASLRATHNALAYEHCARGRQQLYRMNLSSLSEAVTHFGQAVTLDPDYALAHAGLGTAHSLKFLRTGNPDDVARASESLERATRLDPALGEPYPWLVNIRFRQNDPAGSLEAAARGVALVPDLPEAQYFGGGIHYMLAEHPLFDVSTAAERLNACLRLQPLFHPAWIVLGATAMFMGQHAASIDILSRAIALEAEPALAYRFVGAPALRGIALVRAGRFAEAVTALRDALDVLEPSAHVYRDTFRALSYCALGDVALRAGSADEALAHYRHARRIVKDASRLAGSIRLLIRADAGLAAAYAAAGDPARGRQLADDASGRLESAAAHTGTITFECGLGQLNLDLAVAEVRLGRIEKAAEFVAQAGASGWRDTVWLEFDPELRPLSDHPVRRRVLETLARKPRPVVQVPSPLMPATFASVRAASRD